MDIFEEIADRQRELARVMAAALTEAGLEDVRSIVLRVGDRDLVLTPDYMAKMESSAATEFGICLALDFLRLQSIDADCALFVAGANINPAVAANPTLVFNWLVPSHAHSTPTATA